MNVLDWICLGIIVLLAVRCLVRGFVAEVLSVAAYIVAAAAALLLYKQGGLLLASRFAGLPLPGAIAFAAIFILAFLLTRLLGRMLKEGIEAANLSALDKVLGFVLGGVEGLLAVSLILVVMQAIGGLVDTSKILSGSAFARTILPVIGPEVAKALGSGTTVPKVKLPEMPKGGLPQSPNLPVQKP